MRFNFIGISIFLLIPCYVCTMELDGEEDPFISISKLIPVLQKGEDGKLRYQGIITNLMTRDCFKIFFCVMNTHSMMKRDM